MLKLAAIAALAVVAAAPVGAATITTLYSTGVDASGVALTGNVVDSHWTVTNPADMNWSSSGNPTYTGATNGQFPTPPWLADSTTSRWITPVTDAAVYPHDFANDGVYTYTETFSLAGYQVATASFTGMFASDNSVDSIKLNGTTLAGSGGSFATFQSFSSAGGTFVAGDNTLSFVVRNSAYPQGGSNPTGLRVELIGTAAVVPEPAMWAMMVVGFGLVGVATRRRVRTVAA